MYAVVVGPDPAASTSATVNPRDSSSDVCNERSTAIALAACSANMLTASSSGARPATRLSAREYARR